MSNVRKDKVWEAFEKSLSDNAAHMERMKRKFKNKKFSYDELFGFD